jgi:hypothetical protein
VELEHEYSTTQDYEQCAEELYKLNADCAASILNFEHDGSLSCGFEIISEPCTLAYHQEVFPWKEVLNNVNAFGGDDMEETGLHIHVSKRPLSKAVQVKLGMFIHTHQDFCEDFGRRSYNSYCFKKDAVEETMLDAHDRYEAINYTNAKTIEFRFFRSTTDYKTLLACLEFVAALVKWCECASMETIKSKGRGSSAFMRYVASNAHMYKHLDTYINTYLNTSSYTWDDVENTSLVA